ncbi:MAG: hypothetical protein JO300_04740 [Silvibacterium sp.]|nr:hypothetical protein [Silvibacterium sp.]MBV8438325.1 hypothetical protein [Silvibacterium sp.]
MRRAALGFRVHSGWTALVAVSLDGGSPRILARQRPQLVATYTPEFRQPYHAAERKPLTEAGPFIARVESESARLACEVMEKVQENLSLEGHEVGRCGILLASGRPLPDLAGILASHALIHSAEGELFRNALLAACRSHGFPVFALKESALLETASKTLGLPADTVARRLSLLGAGLGAPWSQDEKFSALVAWLALLN